MPHCGARGRDCPADHLRRVVDGIRLRDRADIIDGDRIVAERRVLNTVRVGVGVDIEGFRAVAGLGIPGGFT
jgi:hypothetical protein